MSDKPSSSPLLASPLNQVLPRLLEDYEAALNQKLATECPRCHGHSIVRNGHNKIGRQRFKCMDCLSYYTSYGRGKPDFYRLAALQLYLEGNGFRAIGRIIGVSNVTVLEWIRRFGKDQLRQEELQHERQQQDPEHYPHPAEWPQVVEFDELWSFIGAKKKNTARSAANTSVDRPASSGSGSPSIATIIASSLPS